MNTGIKFTRPSDDYLKIEITIKHEIVDDCFSMNRLNSASEGKRLLMESIGREYETYVKSLAKSTSDLEYLTKEFSTVKLHD